jgi:hypothetical protein
MSRRSTSFIFLVGAAAFAAVACGSSSTAPPEEDTGDTGGDVTGGTGGAGGTAQGGSSGKGGTTSGVGGSGGGTVSPPGDGGLVGDKPTTACGDLALKENQTVGGGASDQVVWNDAACKQRTTALARVGGGYMRQFTYDVGGTTRTCSPTGPGWASGWGYTTNHYGGGATLGKDAQGQYAATFVGKHHAVYEYTFSPNLAGQAVPVTINWFFSTGRDSPVLSFTYDLNTIAKGSVGADTRSPYGDIAWNGDDNANNTTVSGVAWGDEYKFTTTQEPLTMNSPWDYSKKNSVPYAMEWETSSDSEMGIVQTQTWQQHDAGGYWYYSNWGRTSANLKKDTAQVGLMPATWNWPYQMDEYELCIEDINCVNGTTGSHRLAWGTNYGAIGGGTAGSTTYNAYGDAKQVTGWPYQSYSVFGVLGKHTAQAVFGQVLEVEAAQAVTLAATTGSVKAKLPGGAGRTDEIDSAPPGYDHRYSTFNVQAAGNKVSMTFTAAKAYKNPVIVVWGFTGATAPTVKVDGQAQTADIDYLMSLDTKGQKVWITFRPGWSGAHSIDIQ